MTIGAVASPQPAGEAALLSAEGESVTSWTDGYVSDIQYTAGFYKEMTPAHLGYVCHTLGVRPPDFSKPFTYCELGCGQGLGTSLMAAAYPHGDFYGIDFNPGQVANALALATDAGLTNMHFVEDSFSTMVTNPTLSYPMFDVIALHGIYSWVTAENRHAIIKVIERFLKPGGLVYVSYNSMPGWTSMLPFQRLVREHAKRNPARSDQQFSKAFEFINKFKDANGIFFAMNPTVGARMDVIAKVNNSYLPHEYLNGAWNPMFVTDVADEMAQAKLSFLGSATIVDNIPVANITKDIEPLYESSTDPLMKELVKDFAVNQSFRRDIYIRGATQMTQGELTETLGKQLFALAMPRENASIKFKTSLGDADGDPNIYNPILDALATGPKTYIELNQIKEFSPKEKAGLAQAVGFLNAACIISPYSHKESDEYAVSRAFNRLVAKRASQGAPYEFLCAPKIGSGIAASTHDLAVLPLLMDDPNAGADKMAIEAWNVMSSLGQSVTIDGKQVNETDKAIEALVHYMVSFKEIQVPYWRSLGII
jgi:SAM-dependent methyltransferase